VLLAGPRRCLQLEPLNTQDGVTVLLGLAASVGLALTAGALMRDRSWDEDTGRYRDRRGRFTR
jgi:hypothetical protein